MTARVGVTASGLTPLLALTAKVRTLIAREARALVAQWKVNWIAAALFELGALLKSRLLLLRLRSGFLIGFFR